VWPSGAGAATTALPVVGFLHSGSAEETRKRRDAFLEGLAQAGFVDGRSVAIEYRWAEGRSDRLPALAAELLRRPVAVIATAGSTSASVAAKAATQTVPIVFAIGSDPVAIGLVDSLARPGGNVTGVTSQNANLAAKQLELLRELAPGAAHVFALVNPTSPLAAGCLANLRAGAAQCGIAVTVRRASTGEEIDAAFAGFDHPGSVLAVCPDPLFYDRRARITALAMAHRLPAIFDDREYAAAGGLASYGADWRNVMALAGGYTGRILKGAKPADLR
jgi:putative ABC transport system substrate-binding protein